MCPRGIVKLPQRSNEGEARLLRDIFNRDGITREPGGMSPHQRQPTPHERLKGRSVPRLRRKNEDLVLNGLE
jgi:hypothetical protein